MSNTGLADTQCLMWFAAAMHGVTRGWSAADSDCPARLCELNALIAELTRSNAIAEPKLVCHGTNGGFAVAPPLAAHEKAVFSRRGWHIAIKASSLNADFSHPAEQARLAGTLYHEMRHAEQTLRAAILMAGRLAAQARSQTTPNIVSRIEQALQKRLGIPAWVSQAATSQGLRKHHDLNTGLISEPEAAVAVWAGELWTDADGRSVASRTRRELARRQLVYNRTAVAFAMCYQHYRAWHGIAASRMQPCLTARWAAFLAAEKQLEQAFAAYAMLGIEQDAAHVAAQIERRLHPAAVVSDGVDDAVRKRVAARMNMHTLLADPRAWRPLGCEPE